MEIKKQTQLLQQNKFFSFIRKAFFEKCKKEYKNAINLDDKRKVTMENLINNDCGIKICYNILNYYKQHFGFDYKNNNSNDNHNVDVKDALKKIELELNLYRDNFNNGIKNSL